VRRTLGSKNFFGCYNLHPGGVALQVDLASGAEWMKICCYSPAYRVKPGTLTVGDGTAQVGNHRTARSPARSLPAQENPVHAEAGESADHEEVSDECAEEAAAI
jgi:hypothetical protein